MFEIIKDFRKLNMRSLLQVYEEEIQKQGAENYPQMDDNLRILESEQDTYSYFKLFLSQSGSLCCIWNMEGEYVSALRVEHYLDGVLITGLATCPKYQKKGYAYKLMDSTIKYLHECGTIKIYSHIRKDNIPSIKVHEKCGFVRIKDTASFLDRSADIYSGTYLLEN